MCAAAEKVGGFGSILGAQILKFLWRLYPKDSKTRATLLAQGFTLFGSRVKMYAENPYVLKNGNGAEIQSTRLTVDGVPLSYSANEICGRLKEAGANLLGPLVLDRARTSEGKLTRWLTGRRWVWIELPSTPLPRTIDLSPFTGSLYHKEMQNEKRVQKCSNCLCEGHLARECTEEPKCWDCGEQGHKKAQCPKPLQDLSDNGEEEEGESSDNSDVESTASKEDLECNKDTTEEAQQEESKEGGEVGKQRGDVEEEKEEIKSKAGKVRENTRTGRAKTKKRGENAKTKVRPPLTIPEMIGNPRSSSQKRNASTSPLDSEGKKQRARLD